MRKLVSGLLSVSLVSLIISLDGCGDEPKPDACAKEKPVSADFLIYETFGLTLDGWKYYDTDTIASFGVTFVALEKNATYEWTLGSETITTRSFYRDTYPRGTTIDVSLKVTKSPNKKCFPADDGIDFKERTFYTTTDFGCSSRVNGTFRGANEDNPDNVYDITLTPCSPNPNPSREPSLRVTNLVPGCDFFEFGNNHIGYQQIGFAGTYGDVCQGIGGAAKLDSLNNDKIVVSYSVWESPTSSKRLAKKFIGIRKK